MNGKDAATGLMVMALVVAVGQFPVMGGQKKNGESKSEVSQKSESRSSASCSAGSDISVKTENGDTTVTYKGEKVFEGRTSGMVSARASNVNGTEYAAVFDGDKVIWENTSGAADQIKDGGGIKMPDLNQLKKKATKKARKES